MLDAVSPILGGIGDGIRTARGLTSMAGAAATGNAELARAISQFGEILTELLERSATSNERDRQRIVAVRRGYDDIEQANTRCMAGPYRGLGDLLDLPTAGSGAPVTSQWRPMAPLTGRTDRVRRTPGRPR